MNLDTGPETNEAEPTPSRRGPLVALAVIVLLVLGSLYVAHVLSGVSRIQDCVMAGRRNCAPIAPG